MLKVTFPGFWLEEVAGEPPGKIQEYLVAVELEPLNETDPPAVSVTLELGEVIVPVGGIVVYCVI